MVLAKELVDKLKKIEDFDITYDRLGSYVS